MMEEGDYINDLGRGDYNNEEEGGSPTCAMNPVNIRC